MMKTSAPAPITDNPAVSEIHAEEPSKRWKPWAWFLILAIVVVTCIAGFLPRGSFSENWVDWNEDSSQTDFGVYGLAYGEFPAVTSLSDGGHSMRIRFSIVPQVAEGSHFHFLAHIGTKKDEQPFIIGQWQSNLIIMQGFDFADKLGLPRLGMHLDDHIGKPIQFDLSLHRSENVLYANGEKVSWHDPSSFELEKEEAFISIGNGPDGKHGWLGEISQFAIEYIDMKDGSVEVLRDYDFASNTLPQIIDQSSYESHLSIPKVGRFPQNSMLDALTIDDLLSKNLKDSVINFVGFAPAGFAMSLLFFLLFSNPTFLKVSALALVFSVLFSLGIELTQQIIPGRNSHLHDLILNSGGAVAGILGFWILYGFFAISRWFSARRIAKAEVKAAASDQLASAPAAADDAQAQDLQSENKANVAEPRIRREVLKPKQ